MTLTPGTRPFAALLALAVLLPAAAGAEANPFVSRLRIELTAQGQRCEGGPNELLCTNETVATYASGASATVEAARTQGERTYCGGYAAGRIEKGLFEGKAFADVRVLSATISTSGELVCIISYRR